MRSHIIWERSVALFWTELISALRYRRFLFHSFTVEEREKIPLLSEKEWKKKSTGMAAAGIAVLLLTITAGCVPSVGLQGSVFVLLPYAVQLAAACSLAWACARLWGKEYPLREYVYQQTVCKISLRGGICIAAAGVSVIGELAELTRHSDKILSSIPFLLIEVVMVAATLELLKNVKKYAWKRV